MKTGLGQKLDPTRRSKSAEDFEKSLRRKIIGQDSAIEKVSEIYQTFLAGLHPPGRPIGNLLFLGPTGSGKTRVVEAIAETLFGEPRALIKIDCAEFQHSHEIAKLIGSPPGYLGHRETHPLLTQEALNQFHTEKQRISLVLFDEIEKASDSLWQLLLGILDKATLTLGDNRRVDMSNCLIILTSNLGAKEMSEISNGGMGFNTIPDEEVRGLVDDQYDSKLDRTATGAARSKFSPEFMNRIDKVVVFKTLRPEHLETILEIELGLVQQRILQSSGSSQFVFSCTDKLKKFLLGEGIDRRYGARHLKRAIEKHLVSPLSALVSSDQLVLGDFVKVDLDDENNIVFIKEAEGALVPILLEKYTQGVQSPPPRSFTPSTEKTVQPLGEPSRKDEIMEWHRKLMEKFPNLKDDFPKDVADPKSSENSMEKLTKKLEELRQSDRKMKKLLDKPDKPQE